MSLPAAGRYQDKRILEKYFELSMKLNKRETNKSKY